MSFIFLFPLILADPCYIETQQLIGSTVYAETDCSGALCFFANEPPTEALAVNSSHIACDVPNVHGRVRFGVSSGGEPIDWRGLRLGHFGESQPLSVAEEITPVIKQSPERFVNASRSLSLVSGGPSVVVELLNLNVSSRYRCVWREANTWIEIAAVPSQPVSAKEILCGLTPSVSEEAEAVFYVEKEGVPLSGGGIPFSFVYEIASTANAQACFKPDGFCAIRGASRDYGSFSIDTTSYN